MKQASGYSLWFVPDSRSKVHRIFDECIASIAIEHGSPHFIPHVTLLGGMSGPEEHITIQARKLAEKLTPSEIKLGEIGSNGTYFQILFSKVKATEWRNLINSLDAFC